MSHNRKSSDALVAADRQVFL